MGKKWKQWQILFSWGPKSLGTVTAVTITRHLLCGSKGMANLDSILKSRSTPLLTKVHIVKGMVFPGVVCRCESWTIKKAKCQRIDAFQLWYRRRLLWVPWTARRSNQSTLMEINPEYLLQGLMLKLILQYSGYLIQRANSLEKTLMVGKIEGKGDRGDRGWDGWMASLTLWTRVCANSRRQWRTGKPGMLQFMGSQKVRHDLMTEQQEAQLPSPIPLIRLRLLNPDDF